MNRIFTLCMLLLLQLAAHAQGINNSDYNPENPPGPHEDGYADTWPLVNLTAVPDWAGDTSLKTADNSEVCNHVETGKEVTVNAWSKTLGFIFRAWVADGDTVSKETKYTFTMPAKDVNLCAVFDYNPDNPDHPLANKWDKESGEIIMTDFPAGSLNWKMSEVTRRDPWSSDWDFVKNATVAGVCATTPHDDWEAFSDCGNIEFLDYSRTSGLTKVPAYWFSYYSEYPLKTLVMPATTSVIGERAFLRTKELTDVTCFATTPPTFEGRMPGEEYYDSSWDVWAFDGLALDNIIVHVPAESVPLYQEARGWKEFMILPITQNVQRLTVSLPQAAQYKNMFLELANTQTGQSLRYVITGETSYTFNNLIRYTRHNLYIKNQRGTVMGMVGGIDIQDRDLNVSFADLKAPRDITLRLTLPDGSVASSESYTATWTDRMGNYLGTGETLGSQADGAQVVCRIRLDETLGRQYVQPADTVFTVGQGSSLAVTLKAFSTRTLGGTVVAESSGQPLRNAIVTVNQTLNGQYMTTQTTRTDGDGRWAFTAYDVPTVITAQATNYIAAVGDIAIDTIALRDLTGTVVNLDLYYYPTVAEGAEQISEEYGNYDNVSYVVYDETHGREITATAVQYPQLVLVEQELEEGTRLRVTAKSLTNDFAPVTTNCTVNADNQATAAIGITEKGRLHALFDMTDNTKVMGMLYDAEGQLVGWAPYDNTVLTVNGLDDGQYTLVTMGYNSLFTSVSSLTALAETGIGDAAMIKNAVTIRSGRVTEVSNATVPTFKEEDFRLTGEGTSFTVNKTEVTVGQYVTLKAQVDFKASVAAAADVQLLFDLPEGCEYVQQSMMAGSRTVTPQQKGRRLTLSLEDPTQVVRFCVVPTQSGFVEPVAYVSFMNNGQRTTQPIGSATITVESLTITVPETTGRRLLPVTGMATPQSTVQVYDGDVLVAETTSLGTGYWSAMAELYEPYNLSTHTIYAIVTNSEGMKMQSETKTVTVNRGSLTPVVTMHLKGTSSEHHKWDFVFDFRTGEVSSKTFKLTDFGEFNLDFDIDFYDQNDMVVNDTTAISNVKLYVKMEHGEIYSFPLKYNLRYKNWHLMTDYNSTNMPVNVDLDYTIVADVAADRQQIDEMMEETKAYLEESRREMLDVIHAFDDDVEVEEVNIDDLIDDAQKRYTIDFGEYEAMMSQPNLTVDQLEQAHDLLDRLTEQWEATLPKMDVDLDARLADIDKLIEDLENDKMVLRDSVLTLMTLLWYPDTSVVNLTMEDQEYVLQDGDKYYLYKIETLQSIDILQMLADGYVEMPMTDGSSIFCYEDKYRRSFVDTKTMKHYSVELTDVAESRVVRHTEIEVKPVSMVASFFPQDCVMKFTKFIDDCSAFGESAGKFLGEINWDTTVELVSSFASAVLSGTEAIKCPYDNGVQKLKDYVVGSLQEALDRVNGQLNAAKLEKTNLEKDLAAEEAIAKQHRDNQNQYRRQLEEYEKKINNPDVGRAERERCIRRKADCQTRIRSLQQEIQKSTENIGKMRGKLNGKIANSIKKIEKAIAKATEKKNVIMQQLERYLPVKLKAAQRVNIRAAGIFNTPPIKTFLQFGPLLNTASTYAYDMLKWVTLYGDCKKKLPCEANPVEAQNIVNSCGSNSWKHAGLGALRIAADGGSLVLSAAPPNIWTWLGSAVLDIVSSVYSSWQNKESEKDQGTIKSRLAALKCDPDDDEEDGGGSKTGTLDDGPKSDKDSHTVDVKFPFYSISYVRDPSGYVYEAVSSNRVEGVRASCYYKEQKEDMYGDLYDDIVFWDAENYEQENPLYTDADGRYAWDVPTGWWQVKYEKEGYETTYSDWLPVPPPQLEVNVGMTQLRQPMVQKVEAYKNAIEVEFDKYMNPETLNSTNISVTKGGKTVSGTLQLVNAEAGYQKPDVKYASRVAFMPTQPLEFNERVVLTVRRAVESYAGLQMESDFQQEFSVLNDTMAIERDTTQVDSTAMVVATPTASRISGTTVSRGATVELRCATAGATIWYTTDGTCPCDENGMRQRYVTPIVINDHLLLKAYAVKGVMQESEVATFEYFVKGSDMAVTTSAAGYATFYDSKNHYQMPAGLRAFCVEADQNQKDGIKNVYLNGSVIPKGTAVAIVADAQQQTTYTLTVVSDATPYTGVNLLHGSDVATTTTADGDCYFYKACYGPAGTSLANWFGWYPANNAKGPFRSEAHRAWLAIPKGLSTRSYYGFGGDDATNIGITEDSDVEIWYDLQGRRLNNGQRSIVNGQLRKGVYIRNRRKAVVK